MALTPSSMLPLGTPLPLQVLRDQMAQGALQQVSGDPLDLEALAGRPLLLLFICAHCPYVKHIEPEISRLAADFGRSGSGSGSSSEEVVILAISSNSTTSHPADGPEGLRAQAERCGWTFPYLLDGSQDVARALAAACTPDPYLFAWDPGAGRHTLAYRGQLDGSRPGNDQPLDGRDLRAAIGAVLAGAAPSSAQTASIGCNIKWHPI